MIPNRNCTAALAVDRRAVAVAVFVNRVLDFARLHHFGADADKAAQSTVGFVQWLREHFPISAFVLEYADPIATTRRALLSRAVAATAREHGYPVREVTTAELLSSFGHPALRARRELRQVVATIWPSLNVRECGQPCLDAAALGLFVQTQTALRN